MINQQYPGMYRFGYILFQAGPMPGLLGLTDLLFQVPRRRSAGRSRSHAPPPAPFPVWRAAGGDRHRGRQRRSGREPAADAPAADDGCGPRGPGPRGTEGAAQARSGYRSRYEYILYTAIKQQKPMTNGDAFLRLNFGFCDGLCLKLLNGKKISLWQRECSNET